VDEGPGGKRSVEDGPGGYNSEVTDGPGGYNGVIDSSMQDAKTVSITAQKNILRFFINVWFILHQLNKPTW
jgi:hypothetical protein